MRSRLNLIGYIAIFFLSAVLCCSSFALYGCHEHDLVFREAVPPSCTDEGHEEYWECTGCGMLFSDENASREIDKPVTIPAVGHSYDDGVVTTAPGCTEEGAMTYTCTSCGDILTEPIPPVGHSYSDEWSCNDHYHWHAATCGHDDETSDKAEHTFDHETHSCIVCNRKDPNVAITIDGVEYTLSRSGIYCTVSGSYGDPSEITIQAECNGLPVREIEEGAFINNKKLTSVTISDGVAIIGSSAFSGCTGLTSITIPDSVISIGNRAFKNCAGLTSIAIPSGVTNIGEYVFSGCTGLTSITVDSGNTKYHGSGNCLIETKTKTLLLGCNSSVIPSDGSVTKIYNEAFRDCTGLKSITIPDGVTSIGSYTFSGCTRLTSVIIPDSVTRISNSAFYHCTGLTSITIGSSVRSIGDYAFRDCTGLTNVTIPDSVTSIGNLAFFGCTGLTSITIPNSITTINNSTFRNCSGLTSISIPNSVTSIGYNAFSGCTDLTSITVDRGNTTYHSSGNCLIETNTKTLLLGCNSSVIPSDGSVTSIAVSAFSGYADLTSIVIPDSVTYIDNEAFSGCTGLTSIVIPDSVTYMDNEAFSGCTGLTSIAIGSGVTSIEYDTFSGCTGLNSITISDSVTYIGDRAFYDTAYYNDEANWENGVLYIGNHLIKAKTSLSGAYTIKEGTLTIASSAFSDCNGLTSVTIPSSVTSINGAAFSYCTGLTSIAIGSGVRSISNGTFSGCTSLTSVTIGSGVTSISYSAFHNCTSLVSITIPSSVTSIHFAAFYRCTGLNSITIPDSVTYIGDRAFYDTAYYNDEANWENGVLYIGNHLIKAKTSLSGAYTVKEGTLTIASSAFSDCNGLTSITIPDSVTDIGGDAFFECTGLTSVTIPVSVTYIGIYTFYGCNSIKTVYYTGSEEEWNDITIDMLNGMLENADIIFNA